MAELLQSLIAPLAVCALAVLPLAVILPTAPPMSDDASPRPRRAGWRITLSIGRVDDGLKASNLP